MSMTLGDRARNLLADLDSGCTAEETRADVEALLGEIMRGGLDRIAVTPAGLLVVDVVEPGPSVSSNPFAARLHDALDTR